MISYLSNRKQCVIFNDSTSSLSNVHTGVPQGSILGPLLFLIYINDLPAFAEKFNVIMYADDTTLYANLDDFSENSVNLDIDGELEIINNWFKVNKLSLNAEKTKLMVFRKKKIINPINIYLNGIQINETDVFNFLGIVFNNKLTWKNHVSFVSGKIAKNIYVLKTSQFIYPENILKLLYCSLIQSKLLYAYKSFDGLLLWGVELNDILLLQKKAIRCVTSSKFHSHTEPLFKKLQILNIKDLYNLRVLKFCFKLYNLELPVFFLNYLDTINDKCQFYNLRNNHIRIPIHNPFFAKYKTHLS